MSSIHVIKIKKDFLIHIVPVLAISDKNDIAYYISLLESLMFDA